VGEPALRWGESLPNGEAVRLNVISAVERDLLAEVRTLTNAFIAVDDFDPAELESATLAKRANLRAVA